MILINNSERAVIFGGTILIPSRPCDVNGTSADLKNTYPVLKGLMDNGIVKIISEDEAAAAEDSLASKTLDQLRAYAAEKGIDLTGLTKKDDIVAAIEKAGA